MQNNHPDNATNEKYRKQGAQAYRDGVPYDHCPYLPFPDCVEGTAWKNGWLAEKEKAK
jgi:hypothetical protein